MVRFTNHDAALYRQAIRKSAAHLSDEDAAAVPRLYAKWEPDVDYKVPDDGTELRLQRNDKLYKVEQSHQSQADWPPEIAVSLYTKILIPDPDVIYDWEQPGSTNGYRFGARTRHKGRIWVSDRDNNVWEPGVFGWHVEEEETE